MVESTELQRVEYALATEQQQQTLTFYHTISLNIINYLFNVICIIKERKKLCLSDTITFPGLEHNEIKIKESPSNVP